MKRLVWLLVLPYVVTVSSETYQFHDGPKALVNIHVGSFPCNLKEECEDLAVALNEAHAKRIASEPPKRKIGFQTSFPVPSEKKFDYKSACGQNDCGKEP